MNNQGPPNCDFAATNLRSEFIDQAWLNGNGIPINAANTVVTEDLCLDEPNAPADAFGNSFRADAEISGSCGGANGDGELISGATVAMPAGHTHLSCNDEVFIEGIGTVEVTDSGGDLDDAPRQLDHYTDDNSCNPGAIVDRANDRNTIILLGN